jgi:hypothetical protein
MCPRQTGGWRGCAANADQKHEQSERQPSMSHGGVRSEHTVVISAVAWCYGFAECCGASFELSVSLSLPIISSRVRP